MSEAIQKKLFKIEQSNFNSKGTDGETGSGLGLILCKEFAELNNGTISFQSKQGEGTTFWIEFPISAS